MADAHPYAPHIEERMLPSNFRSPPHSFDAEKAILGAILASNRCLEAVLAAGLSIEHFADPVHGAIFDAIQYQIETEKIVCDPVTLRRFFENDGRLQDVGGARYLAELAASMVSIINASSYAALVVDLARRRDLIELGEITLNRLYNAELGDDADKIIADVETELAQISEARTVGLPPDSETQIRATVAEIDDRLRAKKEGRPVGRSTGLVALDRLIGGFKPGRLYILAARPSMGKSAMAVRFADAGGRCFCYSGEMPASEWHERRLGIAARIAPDRIGMGDLTDAEADAIAAAALDLDRSVFIDDTPRLSMAAIRRRSMRYAEKHPCDLIIADHLGKIAWADPDGREVQQLGLITGGMKDLAKEMDLPVVLLVQLNRGVEGREDKRPGLSDLRGSGNIEEDADAVMFLYREAYYLERNPPARKPNEGTEAYAARQVDHETRLERMRPIADIGLAKQRGGATGTAHVYWNGPLMQFGDLRQDVPNKDLQEGMEL